MIAAWPRSRIAEERRHRMMVCVITAGRIYPMWLESLQHMEEISSLLDLMKLAKVSTVLEIGAGPCGTAVMFAEAVGEKGQVVSVDLPPEIGGTPLEYEKMAKAKAENWSMVRGESGANDTKAAVEKALAGRSVGLLFIDGEHTKAAASRDLGVYRGLVERENGLIAFHDITLDELWPWWCSLRGKRHPVRSLEFIHDKTCIGFGIGVLVGRDDGY